MTVLFLILAAISGFTLLAAIQLCRRHMSETEASQIMVLLLLAMFATGAAGYIIGQPGTINF